MIQPTIGRVVWYYQHGKTQRDAGEQPHAALVAHVWGDRMVNLGGFNQNGTPFAATSVRLLQDDDQPDGQQPFAQWMPYQNAQAAKAEAKPANSLAPHQQRVVDEQSELDERLARLKAFMGTTVASTIDDAEKARLFKQASLMEALSNVLGERIASFRS